MWREIYITDFYVILVEPKYGGNIGAVARCMANFNFKKLILVNPCELDDDSFARAKHASGILDNAVFYNSFSKVVENMDYLVATSSIDTPSDKKHLRNPIYLDDFAEKIFEIDGKIGLVFGREDYGLYNEEIATCDIMLRIPTSESYLSLNLSHAVNLVLYTLFVKNDFDPKHRREIGSLEKEKLHSYISSLLNEIDYPDHKKAKTQVMFRRILGRAMPSKWEYHTLMGVFSKTLSKIKGHHHNKEN